MKKIFEKGELKLLWPFYFVPIFLGIFMIYSIFQIPYFLEIGLSLTQIGFLISALGFATLIFEVPTGAIADIFGRKFSVILGIFSSGAILILIYFFNNFPSLLFLFFLLGISMTLISGAKDAWVVDLLKHNKKKNLIQSYYSKFVSFSAIGMFLAGIIGALLVEKFGLSSIWIFTGISFLLNSLIFLFAKEHFIKRKFKLKKQLHQTILHSKNSTIFAIRHKTILLLLISAFILLFVSAFSGLVTWTPFLQELGFKDSWFGYLFSATYALAVFAPIFVKPAIKKLKSYKNYFIFLLSLVMILFLIVFLINNLFFAVLIFLSSQFVWNMFSPARSTFFQSFIPDKMRATISSFREMWVGIATIISVPLAGFFADKIGPQNTITIGGLIIIPAIILYTKIQKPLFLQQINKK